MTLHTTPAIGRGTTWRPLGRREVLPALASTHFPSGLRLFGFGDTTNDGVAVLGGGPVPGAQRCAVSGLLRGPCRMKHIEGSAYCYYHDKLAKGLTEPEEPQSYPVWPLPKSGYVLITEEAA